MSSWSKLIKSGSRDLLAGVGGMIDDGLTKAAMAIDRAADVVYDGASKIAASVLDEIDEAVTVLDESAKVPTEDTSPKVITKEMVLEASAVTGQDKLGINIWDWLSKESTYNMLRDSYGLQLRRYKALGFFMEDIERLLEAADFVSPGAIPGFGPSMVNLLAKVVEQV